MGREHIQFQKYLWRWQIFVLQEHMMPSAVSQHGIGGDDAFKLVLGQVVIVWLSSQVQAECFSLRETAVEVLTEVYPMLTPASYTDVSSLVKWDLVFVEIWWQFFNNRKLFLLWYFSYGQITYIPSVMSVLEQLIKQQRRTWLKF